MPFLVAAMFAASYVHVVSAIQIASQQRLAVFAVCSLVIKVLAQEAAKLYLTKQSKSPTMRSMVVIVATPTIMLDTQLRTVLLCQDSASLKLVGSVLLAVAEIVFRVAKTLYVTRKTPRILPKDQGYSSSIALQTSTTQEGPIIIAHEFLALHSAETYADMTAEYIAMGCSYAILVLFYSHPKFQLNIHGDPTSTHALQTTTIVTQVVIEMLVDFAAVVFEIRRGVNFDHINADNTYLSFFSAVVALANIHISTGIYLNPSSL
ncbi:unnamed protein product [Phytophthora fragariaefolia]|uniref:Unnamed protein product n=1 Tax=Phytophthora fragariaefolia TaxID=1490495 RepID=A0A9W6TU57_9STRA|nr:unnamed protein product [Phytophthora fragariaefolia]